MITQKELQEAITDCLTAKNPTANTCIKLAAFYVIQDHIAPDLDGVSGTGIPHTPRAWAVMEDLLDKLQVVNPNLYDMTMKELQKVASEVARE